jgi:hypothetical protein
MKTIILVTLIIIATQAHARQESNKDANGNILWAPPSDNPSEAGMSPSQRDLQNRLEYTRSQNQRQYQDQLGVFETGRTQKGFQFEATFKILCGDPSEFPGPVPARGQKIYWTIQDQSGTSIVNEKGLLQFSFVTARKEESNDWNKEIHIYFDEAHRQALSTQNVMTAPTKFCSSKSK